MAQRFPVRLSARLSAQLSASRKSAEPSNPDTADHGRSQNRRAVVRRRLQIEKLVDRRVLAAITGDVFDDANHSLSRDGGELGAASRLVYVDTNDNAVLDLGEKIALANESGEFQFSDVEDGTYQIRLFNGSSSQIQTVPVGTDGIGQVFDVVDASQLIATEATLHLIAADSIVSVDADDFGGDGTTIRIADTVDKMQLLPNGSLLIIGSDLSGSTAWVLDPVDGTVSPMDLSGSEVPVTPAMPWSEIAIDGNGRGVVLEQASDLQNSGQSDVVVRGIDASDTSELVISMTSITVPAETTVLASATGSRSVFAWPASEGLELALWSNETESFISSPPMQVDDAESLLTFDDQSGLIAIRTSDGGVRILDANNDFASLHVFAEQTGPIAIDGNRDLMFATSSDGSSLKVVSLGDGSTLADIAADLSDLGTPASIVVGSDPTLLTLQGSLGVSEIRLDKPTAREVVIDEGIDVTDVIFGIAVSGINTPPRYETLPTFQTDEDISLVEPAPGTLQGAIDDESDQFVLINQTGTSNGTISVGLNGSMLYTPDLDFAGEDSFGIVLHDGRDISEEITLEILVLPIPDGPSGIDITIDPVPEDLQPGMPIGDVEVIDADGPGHVIEIDDPRFGADGGQIIFNGGDLDFETEPFIPITITVTDSQTDDLIEETITVTLQDANDPITGILPSEAFVFENAPGDLIAELRVLDQDEEQFHTFTVDDDRFVVEGFDLRLAQGVSLDYETEAEVIVNVTATEFGGGNSYTEAITVTVRDLGEQPTGIGLNNQTVLELSEGAEVGTITLNGSSLDTRYSLQTDDTRFEVVEGTLKLVDDQAVRRSEETQVDVEVTVVDSLGEFDNVVETFTIAVLENETPAHNHENPFDVNHVEGVGALDALVIINYLNTFGPGPVGSGDLGYCYDVNADGMISALDALLVLNHINAINSGGGTVGGEGDEDGEDVDGSAVDGPEGEQAPIPSQQPGIQRLRSFRIVEDAAPVISDSQFASLSQSPAQSGAENESRTMIELALEYSMSELTIADLDDTIVLLSRSTIS